MTLDTNPHNIPCRHSYRYVPGTWNGYFLYLAQRTIPIDTAYAVWTGIGAIGTITIGILFFNDSMGLMRLLSASLIIMGIIGLKFF